MLAPSSGCALRRTIVERGAVGGTARRGVRWGDGAVATAVLGSAAMCWAREDLELGAEGRNRAARKEEGVRRVAGGAAIGARSAEARGTPCGVAAARPCPLPRFYSKKETWPGRNGPAPHAAGLMGALRGCCGVLGVTILRLVPSSLRAR